MADQACFLSIDMSPNYLTVKQVAKIAGKTTRTIYFWIEKHQEWQDAAEHIRGRTLIRRDKLEELNLNPQKCPHCGKGL